MSEAIYLYGFVPESARPPEGLVGVGDAPVEVIAADGFCVAVGRLPADRYGAEEIEPRLRDLAWVGEQGLRHEAVVAWFVDHGQIVPVRLLTLYSSVEALVQDVSGRADEVRGRLRRFAGRREWDLKVSYDAERLPAHLAEVSESVRRLDDEIAAARPGKRFLLERRRDELVRTEMAGAARHEAAMLLDRLRPSALEVRTLAVPPDAEALPVVLNAALLVEIEREADLQREVDARAATLAGYGIEVTFSGPWAPYRFMGDER